MSSADTAQQALEPEDDARAGLYGLIARLFYAAPDAQVLGYIINSSAIGDGGAHGDRFAKALALAWRELTEACRAAFPVVLDNEHTELFVGTGKSEVTPYLSHYVIKHANDSPLVALRARLAEWGIGKRGSAGEPEDHIAGVCEAMRFAIAVQHRSLEEQKDFFDAFVYRGAIDFCIAVRASKNANFYRFAANFAQAFLELEREAFEMM